MLFAHTYQMRAEFVANDGYRYKVRVPIEARFCTAEELLNEVKRFVRSEFRFKTDLEIDYFIRIYEA